MSNQPSHKHIRCVSDFAGDYKSLGFWADIYEREDGTKVLALGGDWHSRAPNTPEMIDEADPHYAPFIEACEEGKELQYARKHWSSDNHKEGKRAMTIKRKKPTTLDMMRGATKRPRMTVPQVLKAIGITWSDEEAKSILESVFGKDDTTAIKKDQRDLKKDDKYKKHPSKELVSPWYKNKWNALKAFTDQDLDDEIVRAGADSDERQRRYFMLEHDWWEFSRNIIKAFHFFDASLKTLFIQENMKDFSLERGDFWKYLSETLANIGKIEKPLTQKYALALLDENLQPFKDFANRVYDTFYSVRLGRYGKLPEERTKKGDIFREQAKELVHYFVYPPSETAGISLAEATKFLRSSERFLTSAFDNEAKANTKNPTKKAHHPIKSAPRQEESPCDFEIPIVARDDPSRHNLLWEDLRINGQNVEISAFPHPQIGIVLEASYPFFRRNMNDAGLYCSTSYNSFKSDLVEYIKGEIDRTFDTTRWKLRTTDTLQSHFFKMYLEPDFELSLNEKRYPPEIIKKAEEWEYCSTYDVFCHLIWGKPLVSLNQRREAFFKSKDNQEWLSSLDRRVADFLRHVVEILSKDEWAGRTRSIFRLPKVIALLGNNPANVLIKESEKVAENPTYLLSSLHYRFFGVEKR